jgi:hypothetical protein
MMEGPLLGPYKPAWPAAIFPEGCAEVSTSTIRVGLLGEIAVAPVTRHPLASAASVVPGPNGWSNHLLQKDESNAELASDSAGSGIGTYSSTGVTDL